ncbi:polar growth protein [Chytriomyces hyalinus]|nr:polar growth protein [Chytriomyces hyalinus]
MDVPSSTVCIPLRDSAMCSSFSQFTAYIPANVAFKVKTVSDFDTLMRESIDLSSEENATGFGSLIASDNGYNCTGFTGGLRYLQSSLCGYFVGLAQGTCGERVPKLPLCLGTADAFFASWGGVLGNTSVCPNGPGQAADMYKNAIMASMQGILNSDLDCLVAQSPETGTCGFSSANEASSFCASNSDTCCSKLALNASTPLPGNSTAFANKSVSATIPSSTSASSTTSNLASSFLSNATIITGASGNSKAQQTQPFAGSTSNQANDQSQTSKPLPLAAILSASVAGMVLIVAGVVAIRYRPRRSDNIEDAKPSLKDTSTPKSMSNYKFPAHAGPVPFVAPIPVSSDRGSQTAVRPYSPVLDDELHVTAGDELIIDTKYEDGWAYGQNLRTRKNGVFPVSIFEDLPMNFDAGNDGDRSTIVESLYSKRASSLYIAPTTVNTSSMNRVVSANQKFDSVYTRTSTAPSTMTSMYSSSESGNIHTVLHDFTPALDDEIELRNGDKVQVDCEYDDGWGYGINFKMNREGLFPLDCLDGFSEGGVKVDARARSIRVSSVFGYDKQSSRS